MDKPVESPSWSRVAEGRNYRSGPLLTWRRSTAAKWTAHRVHRTLVRSARYANSMKLTLQHLRQHAISKSLFRPTSLRKAIERLGFVQADPIRSPARAQDLILRHRVRGYRSGDLEQHYSSLNLEEDFLYAYGFMPRSTWALLHPRLEGKLKPAERRVLEIVSTHKRIHPRELEAYLGREREINAWGGYSKATTRVLQAFHSRGF
jgi:uncharacterized protein